MISISFGGADSVNVTFNLTASSGEAKGVRIINLFVFKCEDSNCKECLEYDSFSNEGICTECKKNYKLGTSNNCD